MKTHLKIATKDEARLKGQKFFYTGQPCKRGHIAQRYASSGGCIQCHNFKSTKIVAPNVHWMTRPIIYSGKMNAPNALQFERMQADIIWLANQLWQSRVNALGPTMTPREQWPEDIRMQVIENHLCAWMYKDDHGRDFWCPVYPEGLRADARYNAHSWTLWDQEHESGGIFYSDDHQLWMVGPADRPDKANTMLLTKDQIAYLAKQTG